MAERTSQSPATPEALYLDLLKKCLTRAIFPEPYKVVDYPRGNVRRILFAPIRSLLGWKKMILVRRAEFNPGARAEGRDWPAEAETMIGLGRLDNLQHCVTDVVRRGVPGDLIETGTWRGGAAIFMRAVLKALGDETRVVWVADSFQGLPKPDPVRYPADAGDDHWTVAELIVSLDEVKANFARYDLLDDQVRFLPGWFRDTLPTAPIEKLAVLRLDGDMYESTTDALRWLYPKLSPGGYCIVDDYGAIAACRRAVEDYRAQHGIAEPFEWIDWSGIFWRRER
jgi:O-methyltransferase